MPLCVHRVPLPLFTSRFIVQSLLFFVCLHVGKGVKTHFHYTETNGGLGAMKRFFVPVGVGYHEAGSWLLPRSVIHLQQRRNENAKRKEDVEQHGCGASVGQFTQ